MSQSQISGDQVRTTAALVVSSVSAGTVSASSVIALPPLTATQMNALPSPQLGWVVFNSTADAAYIYTSAGWVPMGGSAPLLSVVDSLGNTIIDLASNNVVVS